MPSTILSPPIISFWSSSSSYYFWIIFSVGASIYFSKKKNIYLFIHLSLWVLFRHRAEFWNDFRIFFDRCMAFFWSFTSFWGGLITYTFPLFIHTLYITHTHTHTQRHLHTYTTHLLHRRPTEFVHNLKHIYLKMRVNPPFFEIFFWKTLISLSLHLTFFYTFSLSHYLDLYQEIWRCGRDHSTIHNCTSRAGQPPDPKKNQTGPPMLVSFHFIISNNFKKIKK